MQEFGRFKREQKIFYGQVNDDAVTELKIGLGEENYEIGLKQSWNELVILTPCEPNKIILSPFSKKDFLLCAPSSLLPHRSMISLPFPDHKNRCAIGLGVVIGKTARRIKANQVADCLWGYTTLQSVKDETIAQESTTRACSYDTFMPLGPTIRTEIANQGSLELWHNGELKQQAELASLIGDLPERIAEISDAMTLWPGDILAFTLSENAPFLKPGDHVEAIISSLRPLATNVGMRGSA